MLETSTTLDAGNVDVDAVDYSYRRRSTSIVQRRWKIQRALF
jgi:hypothetical protein